ncbi:MAG: FeoA family protein [bacterium]
MFGLRHGRRRQWYNHGQKGRQIKTVADLRVCQQAVVKALDTSSSDHLNKLMALGILPGTKLVLVQRSPSLVLKIGETVLAVDEEVAVLIEVDYDG